jgi:hypothetical protein
VYRVYALEKSKMPFSLIIILYRHKRNGGRVAGFLDFGTRRKPIVRIVSSFFLNSVLQETGCVWRSLEL